jgi:hypothetical protein
VSRDANAQVELPVVPKMAINECSSCGGGDAAEAVMAAGPAHLGGGCHFKAAPHVRE